MNFIGDCRQEDVVEDVFGSVSSFARLVEEKGDSFQYRGISVEYDEERDIHVFFLDAEPTS